MIFDNKNELLSHYYMSPLADYYERYGNSRETEVGYYETWLIQTADVPNMLIEAQLTEQPITGDYTDILAMRQYARQRIKEIKNEE